MTLLVAEPASVIRGLPFSRIYSVEDIGHVARGASLGFDRLGRLAVTSEGVYVVLNDSTWIKLTQPSSDTDRVLRVAHAPDGPTFYGALGSWGIVEPTGEGQLHPVSLRPKECPSWVAATNFDQILVTDEVVYFSGWNGIACYDRSTGAHVFFELLEVSETFQVGGQIFVSSRITGLHRIDAKSHTLHKCLHPSVAELAIEDVTELDGRHVLFATASRRLMTFDGEQASPWENAFGEYLPDRATVLKRLPDGLFALAVRGHGLFVLSPGGELLLSLNHEDYRNIREAVAWEPGILWIATESRIEKIFYAGGATVMDQRLGLRVQWPQVVQWRGRTVLASGGRIYDATASPQGAANRFELIRNQPREGAWAITVAGDQLLIGNSRGVFVRSANGNFELAVLGIDVGRLVSIGPDVCFAIGTHEIAALRRIDGRWIECAPRIHGLGYPNLVHASPKAAWVELGANRVARVSLRDGHIQARLFDSFPWGTATRWINVSVIGNTVVLNAPKAGHLFFDEESESFRDDPKLRRLLERAPASLARIGKDSDGTLWASHEYGVLKFIPLGDDYTTDSESLAQVRDGNLQVQFSGKDDVWFASGSALYHVDSRQNASARAPLRPILVSVTDRRTSAQIPISTNPSKPFHRLSYSRNNLSFRFFAGTYSLRSPSYEFRMGGDTSGWTLLGADSLLTLPDLREGTYDLDVRLADVRGPVGQPTSFTFQIAPPWYRSWFAYASYGLLGLTFVAGIIGWSVRRARVRQAALEKLVQQRTEELRRTMEKLHEETRHTAVLAERNRLAGEIHDSVQQGLNGLMLQVDATLRLPRVPAEVNSRLNVARKMISFTRHEVQHAVWDLESPFLESGDLGKALQKIGELIGSGIHRVEVEILGTAHLIPSTVKHHLLRIAQEAITNAVRHGNARRINVSLHYEPISVLLRVTDDGRGFDSKAVLTQGPEHFGLRGLRARACKISGELHIESSPGLGTSISISAPLSPVSVPEHATVI